MTITVEPLTFEKLAQVSETYLHYDLGGPRRAILLSRLKITSEGSSSLSYAVQTLVYGRDGLSEVKEFETQSLSEAIRHFNNFIKGAETP